jgi:DNA (cytosine-5)-methyltransferase 1
VHSNEMGSRPPKRPPIAIDLFSGAGGLAEGLESSGVRVVAASELHPHAALTHAFNHPHTSVFAGDIRRLDPSVLQQAVLERTGSAQVDLVVGGPPCQGFSTAGKKNPVDPRNELFAEFVRMVKYFCPTLFVFENVPGFKLMHDGTAYDKATRSLRSLGYSLDYRLLSAPAYGVPQRRLRFIMVGGHPDAYERFTWPSPTHDDPADSLNLLDAAVQPHHTVEDALSDIAFLEPGWEAHRYQAEAKAGYALDRRNGCDLLFNHLATRHRAPATALFRRIPEGQTVSSLPKDERPKKVTMARMARWRVSNAVLALPDDMIHYEHDRIPTVREMARLQTFDDDYVFLGKRTSGFMERRVDVPQYTQVGNAVPPLLGRALGKSIIAALEATPRDLRDIAQRRDRHLWVRGSSGFSGYRLDSEAEGKIALFDASGEALPLPVCDDDKPVVQAAPQREWSQPGNRKRTKRAPVVTAPDLAVETV